VPLRFVFIGRYEGITLVVWSHVRRIAGKHPFSKYNNRQNLPMTLGRIGCALAVVAVFCVLGIFFFPAMQGPYSVVHGPVTALLAARAAAGLRSAIVYSGLNALRIWLSFALVISWASGSVLEFDPGTLSPGYSPILRC